MIWIFPTGLGLLIAGWAFYELWVGFKRGHIVAVHYFRQEADRPNQPFLFWSIVSTNALLLLAGLYMAWICAGL